MEILPFEDDAELLYIRIKEDHVNGDQLALAAVSLPDWSTNRSSLSQPAAVIDHVKYPGFARVGELVVGEIPKSIPPDPPAEGLATPDTWDCYPQHDPVEDNPAHSEVRIKKQGGEYDPERKPGSTAYKKKIRTCLAALIRIHPQTY
jgi:hypothetical protein